MSDDERSDESAMTPLSSAELRVMLKRLSAKVEDVQSSLPRMAAACAFDIAALRDALEEANNIGKTVRSRLAPGIESWSTPEELLRLVEQRAPRAAWAELAAELRAGSFTPGASGPFRHVIATAADHCEALATASTEPPPVPGSAGERTMCGWLAMEPDARWHLLEQLDAPHKPLADAVRKIRDSNWWTPATADREKNAPAAPNAQNSEPPVAQPGGTGPETVAEAPTWSRDAAAPSVLAWPESATGTATGLHSDESVGGPAHAPPVANPPAADPGEELQGDDEDVEDAPSVTAPPDRIAAPPISRGWDVGGDDLTTPPPGPPPGLSVPDHLLSWDTFRKNFVLGRDGAVVLAPWRADPQVFLRDAAQAAHESLKLTNLAEAIVHLAAVGQLRSGYLPGASTIGLVARIAADPSSAAAQAWSARPVDGPQDEESLDHAAWKLELAARALCPPIDDAGREVDAKNLLACVALANPPVLHAILVELLGLGQTGVANPCAHLAAAIDAQREVPARTSAADAHKVATATAQALVDRAARLRQANRFNPTPGVSHGNVLRDHCKAAWTAAYSWFERRVLDQVRGYLSESPEPWDPATLQVDIDRWYKAYTDFADDSNARHGDRDLMDEKARELEGLARTANEAMRVFRASKTPRQRRNLSDAIGHFQALVQALPDLLDPLDRYIGRIIVSAVAHWQAGGSETTAPRPPLGGWEAPRSADEQLLAAWERLSPEATSPPPKPELAMAEMDAASSRLGRCSRLLDGLADPAQPMVAGWERECRALLTAVAPDTPWPIAAEWARARATFAETRVAEVGERRLVALPAGEASRARARATKGDWSTVFARAPLAQEPSLATRVTPWRHEVAADAVRSFISDAGTTDPLVESWTSGSPSAGTFLEWIFNFTSDAERRRAGVNYSREAGEYEIDKSVLRDHLRRRRWNPCFLPQFTSGAFDGVIVRAVGPKGDAQSAVQRALSDADRRDAMPTLLLLPQLTADARLKLARQIADSGARIALFDDHDLVRVASSRGGRRLVGMLEVIAEQLPLDESLLPFDTADGQYVRPEMFVGRRDDIEKLTRQPYGQLFSGRKLGKSALLRHIQDSAAQRAERTRQQVIFVDIAGEFDERAIVEKIASEMERLLGLRADLKSLGAGKRLHELLDQWAKASERARKLEATVAGPELKAATKARLRLGDELLILLDEADTFIEDQLRSARKGAEQGLSWNMRSPPESTRRDGTPTVRFLFAGYRVANTRQGAWANWTQLHRLDVLSAADATQLIAGPLASIGVDARDVASTIAWRCNYQPALILRFGQLLLRALRSSADHAGRIVGRPNRVEAEHITGVLADPGMQNEVRWVTWHNFQGNRRASIVYHCLLLEMEKVQVGGALDGACDRIVSALAELNGGRPWLGETRAEAAVAVSQYLDQFADRQLIVRNADPADTVHLRFPHHLALLLEPDLARKAREAIRAEDPAAQGGYWGVLTNTLADAVERHIAEGNPEQPAVFATHWPRAVVQPKVGVLGLAGLSATQLRGWPEFAAAAAAARDVRTWAISDVPGAAMADALRTLRDARAGGFIIGGTDLLRSAQERGERVVPGGRITPTAIAWWFERARGLHIADHAVLPRFASATGGVPLLVSLLDSCVETPRGDEFDVRAADAALRRFDQRISAQIDLLFGSNPTFALSKRERDLVRIACAASAEAGGPGAPLAPLLLDPELWDMVSLAPKVAPVTSHDYTALHLLLHLGILAGPVRGDRIAPLGADPVEQLVALPSDDPMVKYFADRQT